MSIEPQRGGGGWISGPSITTSPDISPDPGETWPEFNPAALVFEVQDVLRRVGVQTRPDMSMNLAMTAAADLLRAMGVRPVSAPHRDRTERGSGRER